MESALTTERARNFKVGDNFLWNKALKFDPLEPLLNSKYKAVQYFTKRNLLDIHEEPVNTLWNLPEPVKLLKRQQKDGSWKYPGKYPKKISRCKLPTSRDLQTFQARADVAKVVIVGNSKPAFFKDVFFIPIV